MERHLKPIGGEHWFNDNLFDNSVDNFKDTSGIFLSGGQSAIRFILEDLNISSNEFVLVPSYLCPSILQNFKKLNVKYEFYKVNKDLSIDIEDINKKLNLLEVKALFLINYFGFYHKEEAIKYLNQLKDKGIIIIEDAVQMLWFCRKRYIGDYIFNSYRKFLPIDGSIVLCNKKISYEFEKDDYYKNIKLARSKKTEFQNNYIGSEEEFLSLYEKAEKEYSKRERILGMDDKSKELLSKIDYKFILKKRKENYCYLFDKLIYNENIQIIYDKNLIEDNVVLGFPILIKKRDEIRIKMREENIYCPVHWDILNESWAVEYVDSRYISKNIITLPIDQRYDLDDMDRVIENINKLVRS